MTAGLDPVPKKTRESTSKVRTGCNTCKARRVKCDEAKPICRRCTVGRRNCDYSSTQGAPSRRNIITVYVPPAQSQPVIVEHNRSLDYFQHNLAAILDGQYDSTFWSRLVLQLSHSEPAVRHAVSAITITYRDLESALQHPAGYVKANPEGQTEWNAAVKDLTARIQAHPDSSLVPLVCCLLFTCIDFLKGHVTSALVHARSGFTLLSALLGDSKSARSHQSHISAKDIDNVRHHVLPVFSGLGILCRLAAIVVPPICAPLTETCAPHYNLSCSRRQLLEISNACIQFIHDAVPKAAMFQIDFDDLIEQAKLQTRLDLWRAELNNLLARTDCIRAPLDQDAVNLLLVHYKVMHIWIQLSTITGEAATDAYHADFEELVYYAEQITKPNTKPAKPQPLSFDVQILGPLYFATLKCRHPTIRRRALEMLRSAPRREGLWNAHHAYVTARRVIELEEMHIKGDELPDEASRLHGFTLPNDESRIYNPHEVPFDIRQINHGIVASPAYPGMLETVFITKPWGLMGDIQEVTEYIKI